MPDDHAEQIQALVDSGRRVALGEGRYVLDRPVYLDRPACEVFGVSRSRTTVATSGGLGCAFVVGIPRVGKNGEAVTRDHRPDAFGVLDASAAWNPGIRAGVASRGELVGSCVSHPMQTGAKSKVAPGCRDEWGETDALTVEVAFSYPPGKPVATTLCGFRSLNGDEVAPWAFAVGDGYGFLIFVTADGTRRLFSFPLAFANPLQKPGGVGVCRAAAWVDLKTGEYGARVNGNTVITRPDYYPKFAGPTTLMPQRGVYPFSLFVPGSEVQVDAAWGKPPDVTVWGLNVRSSAVRSDPGTDLLRYFTYYDADTVAYLPLTDTALARHVDVTAGGYDLSPLFLMHCTPGWIDPTYDASFADLAIDNADVIAGSVMNFSARDVAFGGKNTGLAVVPFAQSYPCDFDRCTFSGSDAGLSLYGMSKVTMRSCDVRYGGSVHARFRGCNVDWRGGMAQFTSARTRCSVDVLEDGGGGRVTVEGLYLDSEARGMTEAVFCARQSPDTPAQLTLRDCYAYKVAPGVFLKLVSSTHDGRKSLFHASGCFFDDPAAPAALSVRGNGWQGYFDSTGMGTTRVLAPGYTVSGVSVYPGG